MSETFADNRDQNSPSQGDNGADKPHGVAGVVQEARRQGEELADIAKERATGFAEEQRALAAKQVGAVAGAVEKTAEGLDEASPDLARYVRTAATKARDVAAALENRSVRDLLGTAESYARREPAIVFGAAVAAGFALVRFLKSSPERAPRDGATGGYEASSSGIRNDGRDDTFRADRTSGDQPSDGISPPGGAAYGVGGSYGA